MIAMFTYRGAGGVLIGSVNMGRERGTGYRFSRGPAGMKEQCGRGLTGYFVQLFPRLDVPGSSY